MNHLPISIVIPTYDRVNLLKETLNSILQQITPDDEIIVIDDGSQDNTIQFLGQLNEPNIKFFSQENKGQNIARINGINKATNSWIALCDSDDLWDQNHLSNFKEALSYFPDIDFYFTNFTTLEDNPTIKFEETTKEWIDKITQGLGQDTSYHLSNNNLYSCLLEFQPIFPSALIFKKSFYESIGGIANDLDTLYSEDAHFIRRLAAFGKSSFSEKPTVRIRKHPGNFSADFINNLIGKVSILERLCNKREIPSEYMNDTIREINKTNVLLFNQLYWNKRYLEAIEIFHHLPDDNRDLKMLIKYLRSKIFHHFGF